MNKNVNVFIGVVLCAVLCGCFVWLNVSTEEVAWGPSEIYYELQSASSTGASYTNATFVAPSSGDVALPLSSSSLRRSSTSLYAGATPSSISLPSLQGWAGGRLTSSQGSAGGTLSSSGGLYATSSAEFKSFGGGGNGGSSMGGAVRGASSSSSLTASSPISLPSLQGGAGGRLSSSDPAQMVAENPVVDMASAANMGYTSYDNAVAGFYNAYTTGSYGSYGNYGGGRSGIRGRQNSGPSNNESAWLNWLALNGSNYGTYVDGVWKLDIYALKNAYNDFCNTWNETMGGLPTWDEWLAWFMNSENDPYEWSDGEENKYYQFLPVGDIIPLIMFALMYLVYMVIRRCISSRKFC